MYVTLFDLEKLQTLTKALSAVFIKQDFFCAILIWFSA